MGDPCDSGCSTIYLLDGTELADPKATLEKLKHERGLDQSTCIILSTQGNNFPTPSQHLISLFRTFGVHKNDRETVLSHEDQMVALQLCLAQINKEKLGEFDVEASKVLHTHQCLLSRIQAKQEELDEEMQHVLQTYTEYKKMCNLVDIQDVLVRIKAEAEENEELKDTLFKKSYVVYDYQPAVSDITQKEILRLYAGEKTVYKMNVEVALEESAAANPNLVYTELSTLDQLVDSCCTNEASSPAGSFSKTPKTPCRPKCSVTELYAEKVFQSYLQLLVNTRCDISLARTLNIPDRELDNKAFTVLKHAASQKKLPMYQMAVSHIMRIRLGGKSYAPDPNHPLSAHVKGLGEFTDLIQKLQTVMEEDPVAKSSLNRIVNLIKNSIVKSRDNCLRRESILAVAERLQKQAQESLELVDNMRASPPKDTGRGGSALGRRTLKAIRQILDKAAGAPNQTSSMEYLSDMISSQHTPLRFTSVLSKFRSPVEASPDDKISLSLAERLKNKINKPKNKAAVRYRSYMDWASEPSGDIILHHEDSNRIMDFVDSKTVAHPACKTKTNSVARKVLESIHDQENAVCDLTLGECGSNKEINTDGASSCKENVLKRKAESRATDNAPKAKKNKVQAKGPANKSRKKMPQLAAGQKQLTAFFRI